MAAHPLDNPIWEALTTCQARFAQTSDLARRFPVEITILAGFLEATRESYESLASLLRTGETAAIFLDSFSIPSVGLRVIEADALLQMVHDGPDVVKAESEAEELDMNDLPQMMRLAELTKPGPFGRRTPELGTYLGVRRGREGLVAMAGERLHFPGYREISAVCTHPDYHGQGYASILVAALVQRIRDRGEVPFLEVRIENTRAIELYIRLGFKPRRTFKLAVLGVG